MSGLTQEFSGKVQAVNVDASSPEAASICKELGFMNHGLVIRSSQGKVLWKQADHQVNMNDVRAQLKKLTQDAAHSAYD